VLALCSWHGVEKRALALKNTLAGRKAARVNARRAVSEPDPAPVRA